MGGHGRSKFHETSSDMWAAFRWVRDRDPIGLDGLPVVDDVADEACLRDVASSDPTTSSAGKKVRIEE